MTRSTILCGCVSFCLASALSACRGGDPAAAPSAAGTTPAAHEESIYAACVDAMVRNTCTAMNDRSSVAATPASGVVLVAGVGRVDAESYRQIRANGESMCSEVRASCLADSQGAQCRTATALWGATSAAEGNASGAR